MKSIRIDDEVWDRIKAEAEPLEDTPNSVLRRIFKLPDRKRKTPPTPPKTREESPHDQMPATEYVEPILEAILELGGQAKVADILGRLEATLVPRLMPKDLEPTRSGRIRWQDRAQSMRYHLIRDGLLERDSPRGYWTISRQGRKWLKRADNS